MGLLKIMSYYNYEFDLQFKKRFSSSYIYLNDNELKEISFKILSKLVKGNTLTVTPLIESLTAKIFENNPAHSKIFINYNNSTRLVKLFDSASRLSSIDDLNEKVNFVHSRLKKNSYLDVIHNYSEKENIPLEFASLALDNDCIRNLVGFFLHKHLNKKFNTDLLNSCKNIESKLANNSKHITPYERVAELRDYIYSICNLNNADEKEIPSKLMRIILSTARLYFSISDDKRLNPSDLVSMINKQKHHTDIENVLSHSIFFNGNSVARQTNKKYIRNWRMRHMRPLLEPSSYVECLAQLDFSDPFIELKLVLLNSGLLRARDSVNFFRDK